MDDTTQPAQTLENALAKVFGSLGQDSADPAVQSAITHTADTLRKTNPGVDEKTIVGQLTTNLPSVINTVRAKPEAQTINQNQLQDMAAKQNAQLDIDKAAAIRNRQLAPIRDIVPRQYTGNTDKANEDFINSAFINSDTMGKQLKNAQDARTGDLKAVGDDLANQIQGENLKQGKIKTSDAYIANALNIQFNDEKSPVSMSAAANAAAALRAAGAPPEVIASLQGKSAAQVSQITNAYKESLGAGKEKADLDNKLRDLRVKDSQIALAGAQAAEASARARGANILADTQKLEYSATKKALDPYINGEAGATLENAPKPIADKFMSGGQQASISNNTKILDGLSNTSQERQAVNGQIEQLKVLVKDAGGLGAVNRLSVIPLAISTKLQEIEKGLAQIEAKRQGSVGGTAAGADAAARASPGIKANPKTILNSIGILQGELERDGVLQKELFNAQRSGRLGTTNPDEVSKKIRSYINPVTQEVSTLGPDISLDVDKQLLAGTAGPNGTIVRWMPLKGITK